MKLTDKTAIVTGGSLGIGKAVALKLAECGANVAVIDLKYEEAQRVAETIQSSGGNGFAIQANVTGYDNACNAVEKIREKYHGVDILINNAGINRDGVIWKMSEDQWDEVIDVNLKGFFNYIRAVAPLFREQKSGKIVNITSINGLRGKFGQANYTASKAGIIGLTKTVARELGKYGVNVNAVAPGLIETDMVKDAPESVRTMALQEIVLKRIGQPEDVANVVAFLCSDGARHITGEVIKVDGGQYI
jgi:3-oxoacyl-[acyl-carrier protein] reductase